MIKIPHQSKCLYYKNQKYQIRNETYHFISMLECNGCESFDCSEGVALTDVGSWREDDLLLWMEGHKMFAQSVLCERGHERCPCTVKEDGNRCGWVCGKRTCRMTCPVMYPLLGGNSKLSPKQVMVLILCYSKTMSIKETLKEAKVSEHTAIKFRQKLDEMMSFAHEDRREEAKGTITSMQVDETWMSKIKVGGPNRNHRVREEGSDIAQVLVRTSRDNKIEEIFIEPVPDRKADTLVPLIEDMALSSRTRIWTDGARHNLRLKDEFNWESVCHRREWVTDTGVHTNTVEAANAMIKRSLRCQGGELGRDKDKRQKRLRAHGELCNGALEGTPGGKLGTVLRGLAKYAREIIITV